jgi:predicted transcriptional regulator
MTGRIGLRDTMKRSCLPEYMIEMAHVLSNQLSCTDNSEQKAHEVLCHTVDDYVQPDLMSLTSSSTVIKTLAIMVKYDTTYVFIVDDGVYKGVVTTLAIAQRMIELDVLCEPDQ